MKTKNVPYTKLFELYDHPSAVLFRAIELRAIYDLTKDIDFQGPSLDLGCGDGVISELLFDSPFTYGVDNGEANDVDIALKNKRYEKIFIESAESMSLPDASVNFVFSNSVIEHIPNNDAVLKETVRLLKPGGHFMFSTPTYNFGKYLYFYKFFDELGIKFLANMYEVQRNKKLNHYHLYDHAIYSKKLGLLGLELVKFSYTMSPKVMELWDKIAVKSVLGRMLFGSKFNNYLHTTYNPRLQECYSNESFHNSTGADMVLLFRKN